MPLYLSFFPPLWIDEKVLEAMRGYNYSDKEMVEKDTDEVRRQLLMYSQEKQG